MILLVNIIGIITNFIVSPRIEKYKKEAGELITSLKAAYRKPQIKGSLIEGNGYDYYKNAIDGIKDLLDHDKILLSVYLKENKIDSISGIKRIIKQYEKVLENLDQGVKRAFCTIPIEYARGFDAELPPISSLIKISELNLARAKLMDSEEDQVNALQTNLLFAFDIGSAQMLLSKMASYDIIDRTNQIINQLIQAKKIGIDGLNEIASLESIVSKNLPGIKEAIDVEWMNLIIAQPEQIFWFSYGGSYTAPSILRLMLGRLLLWRFFFSERLLLIDAIKKIKDFQNLQKGMEEKSWHEVSVSLNKIEKESKKSENNIIQTTLPLYSKIFLRRFNTKTRIKLTALIANIEIYRLKHRKLPEKLIEAVSEQNLVLDPFNNQEFRYVKTAEFYQVYSVGENLADDSGTVGDIGMKIKL
uniref:Uncharacterized protein n=1 Tax=candidate division WOR-3 bacterium TaxID=2052148 RepID=A0A7V1EHP0_UNCW3